MTHLSDIPQALKNDERELFSLIATESSEIPLQNIRTVEISPYDHNIYALHKLIASITHDSNDFVTEPWIVAVNNVEIHRANTWAKCYHYITWHYKQGTLPIQREETESAITTNDISYQIAAECEKFGFKLHDDGIYNKDVKLGEVGCTDGRWWVYRASSEHQLQIPCNSVYDAVWSLWMTEVSLEALQSAQSQIEQYINQQACLVSVEQSQNYSIKSQALNFLPIKYEPTPTPNREREIIKHMLIGSSKAVMGTIQVLHQLGYAQVGDWSPLLPSPTNPGEVMSILVRQILVQ